MKKGLLVTFSTQQNNSLQYTWQDQNYLPRLLNFLNLEYDDFIWEHKAFFQLTEEIVQQYDAAAITALTRNHTKQLQEWNPQLQIISVSVDQFLHSMAPRGFVAGMTTGYLLAEAPLVNVKDTPAGAHPAAYTEKQLRELMRTYPTIYWQVVRFEELKLLLAEASQNITVALAPAAAPYQKFLTSAYPTISIISAEVSPTYSREAARKDEKMMLAISGVTVLLLILLTIF